MKCPRCARALAEIRLRSSSSGGAYREALRLAHRCDACGLWVLDPGDAAARLGSPPERLARSALLRDRKRTTERCPGCGERLDQLTLSWGERWVVIEECGACGRLVADPGELEKMAAMAREAAGLGWLGHASSVLDALAQRSE